MASSTVVSAITLLLIVSSACNVEGGLRSHFHRERCPGGACNVERGLRLDFHRESCPGAEFVIREVVHDAIIKDRTVGAALLRLLFHDCFVQGCDASVLIDDPNHQAEKDAIPNQTLVHLEIIDEAKAAVDIYCQRPVVSCADTIAFAAAQSVASLGGPIIDIEGGRFDGFVSSITQANQGIPSPFLDLAQLQASFGALGLDTNDLVTLSGAHTVGVAHCGTFGGRIRNFNSTFQVDPTLDSKYAEILQNECPANPPSTTVVSMDPVTDNFFDNLYHKEVRTKSGLFTSDAALYTSPSTKAIVDEFAANNGAFLNSFAVALKKMASIGVKTSANGNIRTNCRSFN